MKSLKTIAAGAAIAGALGFAAIGVSEGVASAAPVPGGQFAQDPGWGHGPDWGHDHGGGWRGPGGGGPGYWAPPPYYGGGYDAGYGGYGGYGPPPPPCLSGPLGFVQVCA
ncbi:MAG: hypothetical protein QOK33_1647 [Mycobacterium sp.]|jgi:hypothetical protein|nr:hypothetical protein [Mycobacterium sp.]